MSQLWNWLKTNKTTLIGIFTILWGAFSTLAITKKWLDVETLAVITTALTGLGLLAAKDANKHSTNEQVTKATIKKRKLEEAAKKDNSAQ